MAFILFQILPKQIVLPESEKHNTVPILPEYRVVLLGNGAVFVNPVELT